jgi:hypothetical protein
LDGINAWTHCYLKQNEAGTELDDWNLLVPDQEMENQPARNPVPGLSLFRRTATAQRDISTALSMSYPSYVDEIIDRLAPLPTTIAPDGRSKVWAVAENRTWFQSAISNAVKTGVHFSSVLFPIWPSETVDGFSADAATQAVALSSTVLYANLSCSPVLYPEEPYKTCVDAGWGGLTIFSALARVLPGANHLGRADHGMDVSLPANVPVGAPSGSVTGAAGALRKQLADAFSTYVSAYGANATNLLGYAPGGGIENIGLR